MRAEDPVTLGVFRIVVCALVLTSEEVTTSLAVAPPDRALWAPPEGLQTLARLLPVTEDALELIRVAVMLTAVLGLVGLGARFVLPLLTLCAAALFAVPQLAFAPRHNMHLLWFLAILAASPSASALSFDAKRKPLSAHHPLEYTLPIWTARTLLACIYFFPGFWKLAESGLEWITSDNLVYQMYWKWHQNGFVPSVRVDRIPALVKAGAAAVVAFELSFPLLMWSRRTRIAAAIAGLAFHLLADAFLLLPYSSLWWCYVVLIDWKWISDWLYDVPAEQRGANETLAFRDPPRSRLAPLVAIAAIVVVGNVVQGVRNAMLAWPFACYPTFQWLARPTMPDLLIAAVDVSGRESPLLEGPQAGRGRSQRRWGVAWRAAGAMGPTDMARLRAVYELIRRESPDLEPPPGSVAIRFYRAEYSVVPEHRAQPPVSRKLLAEMPLDS